MTLAPRGTLPAILRGMALVARGRPEGLNCFGDTPRAFLGSLAPGLGFMAGAVVEGLAGGQGARAFGEMLAPFCALLAPPVLSHELARLWGREAFWGRYIVAFDWCQWLLPMIGILMLIGMAVLRSAGAAGPGGFKILFVCLAVYALWLNWFLARHGLALGKGRAAVFVVLINLGTMTLVFGPVALAALAG